jgi:Ca-activated chloride channel family protein
MVPAPVFASFLLPLLCFIALSTKPIYYQSTPSSEVAINPRVKRGPAADAAGKSAARLRMDVPLVLVPAHVSTLLGTSVANLDKENFRLFEDNIEQTITHFSKEDAPLSVGLVFDASGSMRNKMGRSAQAVNEFLRTINPEDEFFLIEFNEKPRLSLAFTQNSAEVQKRIVHAKPLGRTALFDAIHLALTQMKNARNLRKAIVILSDGGDNHSRHKETETKRAIWEADVQVFTMGILDKNDSPKRPSEEQNGPHLLDELAQECGGRYFPVGDIDELPAVCRRIGTELRTQYLLGYSPANAASDGKYHRIKVALAVPQAMPTLKVHHRMGYYARSE